MMIDPDIIEKGWKCYADRVGISKYDPSYDSHRQTYYNAIAWVYLKAILTDGKQIPIDEQVSLFKSLQNEIIRFPGIV
jgi:hypothetical protein